MAKCEKNNLIEPNIGLVHSCANRFRGRGAEYDDLFQAGCVGLVKAASGFDEGRGFAFSTYAVPVILGEIKRVFRDGGAVKVGRGAKEKARVVLKARDDLTARLDREPTISELAGELKLEISETAELLCVALPPLSLTADDSGEANEGGAQLDIKVDAPEKEISDKLALSQVLETLEERDRSIINLRYFKGLTQTKTAAAL
ncbi:MAG: sigma-70 family RNA polymerase sigma factor, partial [Oscillospiraceae bacterium]|nr:sigma-70 family RNA polymerase sigma factor [Oscillospiraceae bacterium]